MKKSFLNKLKTLLANIDKPSLIISCTGMILALGVAGYAHALKVRLDTTPLAVTTIRTTAPSVTATPSATPSTATTPTPSVTPSPTPVAKKAPAKQVVTYVTQTAPQSSVDSLRPHTSAPSTPSPSTAPGTAAAPPTSAVSYTSSNWSGYLATGGSYTAVSGSWTVPSPTSNGSSTSLDAAWVGIGGVTSNDLIQAGTIDTVSASGQVTISAFYEILPAPAQIAANLTISPGDVVSASVTQTGTNSWQIIVSDQTTGKGISKNLSYASSLSSAEWIEEDPSDGNNQLYPLAYFGSIAFSAGSATVNGSSMSIAGAGGLPITMISGGRPVATPSALSGGNFTVTRGS